MNTANRLNRRIFIGLMAIVLTAVYSTVLSAQCVDHPAGKTAVKFNNETSYELTFFIDEAEAGVTVPSKTSSAEQEVTPGEHLLRALGTVDGQFVWVWVVNDVPRGQVCTWTLLDPEAAQRGPIDRYRTLIPSVGDVPLTGAQNQGLKNLEKCKEK
jgi:hypothetical protein